jgi:hypothetical protein
MQRPVTSTIGGMAAASRSERAVPLLDEDARRLAGAAIAGASLGWWPAFTMGVYGVIFFEQHLALWAAATAAFLALGLARGVRVWRRPAALALLLPSLWMALAWILPVGGTSGIYTALYWFGVVITVFGLPALAAFLVRVLIPGAERLQGRERFAAIGVVALVMASAFLIGTQHPRMLTCEDFTISGNFAPEGCSSGTGTTER